jgi:hypothetical protein
MTWPLKIRVYPEDGALYATAYIWPTKRAMRAYARRTWGMRDRFGAYCQSFTKLKVLPTGRTRTSPQFAELHFARTQMGSETVAHEFTHAAWAWARRVGWTADMDALAVGQMLGRYETGSEERFCYALGAMVRQFVERAYKAGAY